MDEIPIPPLVWCGDLTVATAVHEALALPDITKLRVKFGFFLDEPFPKTMAFDDKTIESLLPLIVRLLKNHEIAFRTRESAINFLSFCGEVLSYETSPSEMFVKVRKRKVRLCSLPLGLPFDRYRAVMMSYLPMLELPPFETSIFLRIDLLSSDSTYRMRRRLKEFQDVIEYEPRIRGMIVFVQILLLETVGSIAISGSLLVEKEKADRLAAEVNAKYDSTKWTPVVVMLGLPTQPELQPFYKDFEYMCSYGKSGCTTLTKGS